MENKQINILLNRRIIKVKVIRSVISLSTNFCKSSFIREFFIFAHIYIQEQANANFRISLLLGQKKFHWVKIARSRFDILASTNVCQMGLFNSKNFTDEKNSRFTV